MFFESRQVTVNSITLYGKDDNTGNFCVTLFRTSPWDDTEQSMGSACTTGADDGPRAFTQTALSPRQITGQYGPYLWLYMPSPSEMVFYAVRLSYSYTP